MTDIDLSRVSSRSVTLGFAWLLLSDCPDGLREELLECVPFTNLTCVFKFEGWTRMMFLETNVCDPRANDGFHPDLWLYFSVSLTALRCRRMFCLISHCSSASLLPHLICTKPSCHGSFLLSSFLQRFSHCLEKNLNLPLGKSIKICVQILHRLIVDYWSSSMWPDHQTHRLEDDSYWHYKHYKKGLELIREVSWCQS